MPVNRGPSFARYNSAIAAAAALEAAKADQAKKKREQAAELRQSESRRTPASLSDHHQDVA
ncbi:MAG: hypothetical protein WAL84_14860 [Candidatus Dormiibacterota bacterium]